MAGEMLRRRILLEQVDPEVSPLYPFGRRATDADIAAAESRLGHALDTQHVELLKRVNGWPQIFACGDLLGTGDLGQGQRWDHAQRALTIYYTEGDTTGFPPREAVYPLHVVEDSVFVVDMSGPLTHDGHPVYWLAEDLVDQWPSVRDFWLAGMTLVDHARQYVIRRRAENAERNSAPVSPGKGFTPIRLDPDPH
jgi:hypothetical protein